MLALLLVVALPGAVLPQLRSCNVWSSGSVLIAPGSGAINRSTDGGVTWTRTPTPFRYSGHLCAIGGSGNTVIAAGAWGQMLRSTDLGVTWTPVATGVEEFTFQDIWAWGGGGGDTIVAVGDAEMVYRSTDAGRTWQRLREGPNFSMTSVWGAGPILTATGSDGSIQRSTDGGVRWSRAYRTRGFLPQEVWGSGNTLIAVGSWASIIRSADGGKSWSVITVAEQPPPVRMGNYEIRSGSRENYEAVWGAGGTWFVGGTSGTILRSTDDGVTWAPVVSGTAYGISALWGTGDGPDAPIFGVSFGNVIRSTDGGAHWAVTAEFNEKPHLVGIAANGPLVIGVGGWGAMQRSTDGGKIWRVSYGTWTANHLNAVWIDGATAVAVGDRGTIGRSTDSGATWTNVPLNRYMRRTAQIGDIPLQLDIAINSVWGRGELVFAAGDHGTLLRSRDGGVTWSDVDAGTDRGLAVWGHGDVVIAVGPGGTIRRSTDAGERWSAIPLDTAFNPMAVSGADSLVVAVGLRGLVLRSTDLGKSWRRVTSGTSNHLYGVWVSRNGRAAVAVGDSGTILRSHDGGASWERFPTTTRSLFLNVTGSDSTAFAVSREPPLIQVPIRP